MLFDNTFSILCLNIGLENPFLSPRSISFPFTWGSAHFDMNYSVHPWSTLSKIERENSQSCYGTRSDFLIDWINLSQHSEYVLKRMFTPWKHYCALFHTASQECLSITNYWMNVFPDIIKFSFVRVSYQKIRIPQILFSEWRMTSLFWVERWC